MVKKPLSLNHYAYLNQLLDLKGIKPLEPKKEIPDKDEIINKLIEKQKELEAIQQSANQYAEAQANLIKIQRSLEILKNEEKRKHYDEALTNQPNVEFKHKEKGTMLVALVPIEDIIKEFDGFQKEMLGLKDAQGNPLHAEGDFKYEKIDGPPEMHVFHFPDEKSAHAFIDRLFNKNMAMLPNGSQDIESIKPQSIQKIFKDKLTTMKTESELENEKKLDKVQAAPNPFTITPNQP